MRTWGLWAVLVMAGCDEGGEQVTSYGFDESSSSTDDGAAETFGEGTEESTGGDPEAPAHCEADADCTGTDEICAANTCVESWAGQYERECSDPTAFRMWTTDPELLGANRYTCAHRATVVNDHAVCPADMRALVLRYPEPDTTDEWPDWEAEPVTCWYDDPGNMANAWTCGNGCPDGLQCTWIAVLPHPDYFPMVCR